MSNRHVASRRGAQRDRSTRRHDLGRPPITEIEIGNTTHYVVEDVDPLDTDGVWTMIIGTVLWGVATIAILPFLGTLDSDGHSWWLWTSLGGLGLGLIGIEYCRLRRAARDGD